jgi:hypothetical protein
MISGDTALAGHATRLLVCLILAVGAASDTSISTSFTPRGGAIVADRLPRLRGVNVLTGGDMAYVSVRLTREARLVVGHSSTPGGVTDGDKGRVAGVVVTRDPPDSDAPQVEYAAGRFAECSSPGCAARRFVGFQFPARRTPTLSPGDYRLYLLADGSPVRVVLRFRGLDGRARFAPSIDAYADLQTPLPRLSSIDPTTYSAGAEVRTFSSGVILAMMSLEGERHRRYAKGICSYTGPRPPQDVAYGPQCAALLGARHIGTYSDAERYSMVYLGLYSDNTVPPNTDGYRGVGMWAVTDGAIRRTAGQVLAIPFP